MATIIVAIPDRFTYFHYTAVRKVHFWHLLYGSGYYNYERELEMNKRYYENKEYRTVEYDRSADARSSNNDRARFGGRDDYRGVGGRGNGVENFRRRSRSRSRSPPPGGDNRGRGGGQDDVVRGRNGDDHRKRSRSRSRSPQSSGYREEASSNYRDDRVYHHRKIKKEQLL